MGFFTVQVVIFRADTHILMQPLVGDRAAAGGGCEPPTAKRKKAFSLLAEILHLLGKPAVNSNSQKQGPCSTAILYIPSIQDT